MQNGPRALPDTGVVRQSARPAASSVAATVSPSRAANGLPSMVTASSRTRRSEAARSGSRLYIDAHIAQRREGTHRAVGQGGKNGHPDGVVKACFLLRIADQYRAFVGLSQRRDRMVQKSAHAFEYQDLSPLWADRCNESDLRCELGIAQTRRQHDLAGPKRLVLRLQIKALAAASCAFDSCVREVDAAMLQESRVQRSQQFERIHMAVQRRVRAADD